VPSSLLLLLTVGLVAVHLWAPLRWSMSALLATTFLVPAALLVPGAPSSFLVARVGLVAAAAGIVRRVGDRQLDVGALRPSRVLLALAAFVVAAYALGVAGAPLPSRAERAVLGWWLLADQLLFLWVATVAVRALGARQVARVVAALAVTVAVIGIAERYLGTSYARWWFEGQRGTSPVAGQTLELRGSQQRVRATAEFALQYAWVLAFFLPLVSVLALRARRAVALLAPALMALALVFSISRSAYAGLGASAVALLLFAPRNRRLIAALAAAGIVAAFLYLGTSAVREPYSAASPDSVASRERRLELVTGALAPEPWFGIGLDGLEARGITSTDSHYLLVYAGVGVLGLALLVGALGTAIGTAGAAARHSDDEDAPLAAAVLGGVVSGGIAAFSFDSLSGPFSSWTLWLLAAMAVGLSEQAAARLSAGVPGSSSRRSPWRLALPLVGCAAGLALVAATPTHAAVHLRMFVLDAEYLVRGSPNDAFVGRLIINSTCQAAEEALGPQVTLDCRDPQNLGPGTASVRIEAADLAELAVAQERFVGLVPRVHRHSTVEAVGAPRLGRPTWARTAPLWAAVLAAEAALLVPPLRPRRRWAQLRASWRPFTPYADGSRQADLPGPPSVTSSV
jgi:hypothetical protein